MLENVFVNPEEPNLRHARAVCPFTMDPRWSWSKHHGVHAETYSGQPIEPSCADVRSAPCDSSMRASAVAAKGDRLTKLRLVGTHYTSARGCMASDTRIVNRDANVDSANRVGLALRRSPPPGEE